MSISGPVADFLGLPAAQRSVTQQVEVIDECEEFACDEVGKELLGEPAEGFSTSKGDAATERTENLRAGHAGHGAGDSKGTERRANLFALQSGGQRGGLGRDLPDQDHREPQRRPARADDVQQRQPADGA